MFSVYLLVLRQGSMLVILFCCCLLNLLNVMAQN